MTPSVKGSPRSTGKKSRATDSVRGADRLPATAQASKCETAHTVTLQPQITNNRNRQTITLAEAIKEVRTNPRLREMIDDYRNQRRQGLKPDKARVFPAIVPAGPVNHRVQITDYQSRVVIGGLQHQGGW